MVFQEDVVPGKKGMFLDHRAHARYGAEEIEERLVCFLFACVHVTAGTLEGAPDRDVPRDDSWHPARYTIHTFSPFAISCPGSLSAFAWFSTMKRRLRL
jgi:hypothetical protein